MAHVAAGSGATSAEYNAHDDRIQNLENSVVTSGGAVGSASLDGNVGWKEQSGTLSSTGSITVTHGLGFTPRVWIQMRGNPSTTGPYITYVSSITSSTFIVFFGQISSTGNWNPGASGQSVTFDWLALEGDSA